MSHIKSAELKDYSYYKTGGICQKLYLPKNIDDLQNSLIEISKSSQAYFILGLGSNSLVMDEAWQGSVISFLNMKSITRDHNKLICLAGADNSKIAEKALENSLSGAAWMFGLPGLIGATARMNARCYGGEISQIASKITALSPKGDIQYFYSKPEEKHVFRAYKNTIFMENSFVIAEVELSLNSFEDPADIKTKMQSFKSDREAKHQYDYPTCGCVFKNNYSPEVSISSGLLLEKSGVKTLNKDLATVSPYHANFVYNKGCTSRDILELTFMMREKVWAEFGVWLEYEMEILGNMPNDLRVIFDEKRKHCFKKQKLDALRKEFQKKS